MRKINNYIQEKLKLNKSVINKNQNIHTLFPKTKNELIKMIKREIKENGKECSLNHIDVSKINDLTYLFACDKFGLEYFDGDISEWNVSNVTDMFGMFLNSCFTGENGDISNWDISNVENIGLMFQNSMFDGDIENWNPKKLKNIIKNSNNSNNKQTILFSILHAFRNCRVKPKWYEELLKLLNLFY